MSPVRDEHGKIVGASKICRDISARKRAEAVLARRADEQAALYRFTDRLYRAVSVGDIYEAAFGCDHCRHALQPGVDTALRRRGVMRFVAWRGLSDRYRNAAEGHSPWPAGEINPEPVCLADTS